MRLAAIASALALAACTAQSVTTTPPATAANPNPAPVTTTVFSGPLSGIANFTSADLTNAIAVATAAGTAPGQPGHDIVPCLTFVQGQLAALQAPQSNGTVGVVTAFVVADLALSNVNAALSPAAQQAYDDACGPMILGITNRGLSLPAQLAALMTLIK